MPRTEDQGPPEAVQLRKQAVEVGLRVMLAAQVAKPLVESLRQELQERHDQGHLLTMWGLAIEKARRELPEGSQADWTAFALKDILDEFAAVAGRRVNRIAIQGETEAAFLRGKAEGVELGVKLASQDPAE